MRKMLLIDSNYSGISGDLLISSLAQICGPEEMHTFLQKVLDVLIPEEKYKFSLDAKKSQGIEGLHLTFVYHPQILEHHLDIEASEKSSHSNEHSNEHSDAHPHPHPHSHSHSHSHPHPHSHPHLHSPSPLSSNTSSGGHSHYSIDTMHSDLARCLSLYSFSALAKQAAKNTLNIIIQAEAAVHGVTLENVHLHEIGSRDTLLDICGVLFALEKIGVFSVPSLVRLSYSPIAVGEGTVKCDHGIMPIPAPATTKILESHNLSFKYGPVKYELATPTGVAILASLKDLGILHLFPSNQTYSIDKVGIGVGTLEIPHQANILRTFLFNIKEDQNHRSAAMSEFIPEYGNKLHSTEPSLGKIHEVWKIETNVDDVRGEILGYLIPLLMRNNALDVSIISTITKKNRPGYLITIICHQNDLSTLSRLLIAETGSLGVRISKSGRLCLNRQIIEKTITIDDHQFKVQIKIAKNGENNMIQSKIEYEDLVKISQILHKPIRIIEKEITNQLDLKKRD